MSMEEKKAMIIADSSQNLSIRRKCELLDFSRSNLYRGICKETAYNLLLMRLLDEEYTRHPCKGVLKMVKYLEELEHFVNHKRVRRLLRLMGLMAIYPKPRNLSKLHPEHKIYPYLLNGVDVCLSTADFIDPPVRGKY